MCIRPIVSVLEAPTPSHDLQAPADAIRSTVDALSPVVDVGGIYQGLAPGPKYTLRCATPRLSTVSSLGIKSGPVP